MARSDTERLAVELEARINQFEKQFLKANRTANTNWGAIERRGQTGAKRLEATFTRAAGSLARAFGPALGIGVGVASLAGLTNAAKQAVGVFDELAKSARTVGLSTDLYQSLGFAALEEGVKNVDSALIAFTRRSGQLAAGQGELSSFLAKTNAELLRQLQAATSQEERLRLLADAIANTSSAEEKAALTAAAFSKAGIDLVRVLDKGAAGLDDYARRAREAGIIVDESLLAKSEELNNTLGVTEKILDVNLKQAFVELTPLVIKSAEAIAAVAREINRTVDATRALGDRRTQFLDDRAKDLQGRMRAAENATDLFGRPIDATQTATYRAMAQEYAAITEELRARAYDRLGTELAVSEGIVEAFETETAARQNTADGVLESLQFELEQLGRTAEGQRLYNELLRAGVTLESEQGQAIAEAVSALQNKQAELDKTTAATEAANEAGAFLGQTLSDSISSTIPVIETGIAAVDRLTNALIEAVLQAALLGSGPLGGLFGGGLSGLFSGGGNPISLTPGPGFALPTAAGGGEIHGPGTSTSDSIFARLSDGEYVVNAAATRRNRALLDAINSGRAPGLSKPASALGMVPGRAGAQSSTTNHNVSIGITVSGARGNEEITEMVRTGVHEGLEAYDETLPSKVTLLAGQSLDRGDIG